MKNNFNKKVWLNLFTSAVFCLFIFAGYSVVHAGVVIQPTPTTGLRAHWTFDTKTFNWSTNKVSDVSGNGHTGTLVFMDSGTNQVAGKKGQAIFLDGSVDSISLATNPLTTFSNPSSACTWVNTNDITVSTGGFNQTILNLSADSNNGLHMGSVVNSGKFFASYKSGGSYYGSESASAVFANNQWVHVCYVWNGNGVNLYANGTSVSTTTNTDAPSLVNTVGARNDQGDGTWSGMIDDLRVYNRALTIAEIKQIYNSGALVLNSLQGNKTVVLQKTPSNFLTSGLVGYWSFDGSKINWASNTVTDSSGNGNTGTMISMSTTTSPAQGKVGQALSFDGVNDRITFSGITMGTTHTVSMWIYPIPTSDTYGTLFSQGSNIGIWYRGSTSKITYIYSAINHVNNTTLTENQWHHVVIVSDGGSVTFYLDGQSDGTSSSATGYTANTMGDNSISETFKGKIDDVRIYNRALSATEVGQLYRLGR